MKSCNSITIMLTSLMLAIPTHHAIASELDAHEHGSANLDIAIDTDTIHMSFESPAVNIVGFEYDTKDQQQLLLIKQAIDALSNVEAMFSLVGDVSCQTVKSSAHWVTEHEEDHEQTPSAQHAEFIAEYELSCKQLDNLAAIEVNLFDFFKAIADLDVQVIYSGGQVKQALNSDNTMIELAY